MQKYDLIVLTKADLNGEAKDKFVSKLEAVIKTAEGKVVKTVEMGKKQLAYKIKNLSEANFLEFILELPSQAVLQLDKKLTVDREVVRHLLVKAEN